MARVGQRVGRNGWASGGLFTVVFLAPFVWLWLMLKWTWLAFTWPVRLIARAFR